MHRRLRRTSIGQLALLLVTLFADLVFAECPNYSDARPAQLHKNSEQNDRIAEFISDLHDGELVRVVKFGAYVNKQGRIEHLCCGYSNTDLTNNEYRDYARMLYDLVFTPATYGDDSLRVFVSMSLVSRQFPDRVENTPITKSTELASRIWHALLRSPTNCDLV